MRIPIDGHNDAALVAVATDSRELISGLNCDADKRVFVLQHLQVSNEHATDPGVLELWDQDESTAGAVAANQRGPSIHVGPGQTLLINFAGGLINGGIRFVTNLVATVTAGTFPAFSQSAQGYLE